MLKSFEAFNSPVDYEELEYAVLGDVQAAENSFKHSRISPYFYRMNLLHRRLLNFESIIQNRLQKSRVNGLIATVEQCLQKAEKSLSAIEEKLEVFPVTTQMYAKKECLIVEKDSALTAGKNLTASKQAKVGRDISAHVYIYEYKAPRLGNDAKRLRFRLVDRFSYLNDPHTIWRYLIGRNADLFPLPTLYMRFTGSSSKLSFVDGVCFAAKRLVQRRPSCLYAKQLLTH